MAEDPNTSQSRLASVVARIAAAARAAGREPASVNLVAVTKTFGAEHITPVLDAGHRLFGENRVQEAKAKWPALRERYPGIELHLIGPLQSNKAREAVAMFDAIHTIDRPKIAQAIAEEMAKQGRRLKLFIEVNTGEEPQKAGIDARRRPTTAAAVPRGAEARIAGLMCIPPRTRRRPCTSPSSPSSPAARLAQLSMGMSADFEIAIAFGATYVRVGSQIFGTR